MPPPALVTKTLTACERVFEPQQSGVCSRMVSRPFYRFEHNRFYFRTPLLRTVRSAFEAEGHIVRRNDELDDDVDRPDIPRLVFSKRLVVDESYLSDLEGDDRQVAEAVLAEPYGQIEVASVTEMFARVRLLCRLYPKANVLLPVPSKDKASNLRVQLGKIRQRIVTTLQGRNPDRPGCMISCFADFGKQSGWQADLIVLTDPWHSLGKWPQEAWKGIDYHQGYVYAMTPRPGPRVSAARRLQLESIAGPLIYRLPSDVADVKTIWLEPPAIRVDDDLPTPEFKQAAYWYSRPRNEFVAGIGRAIAAQNTEKLAKYGIPLAQPNPTGMTAVCVVVESAQHARELSNLLPDWKVVLRHCDEKPDVDIPPGMICTVAALKYREARSDFFVVGSGEVAQLGDNRFHPGMLHLSGLSSLTNRAAKGLGRHPDLFLDGLQELSPTVAGHLCRRRGSRSLSGLQYLSASAAQCLGRTRGFLNLDGLTSLSRDAAVGLSRHVGNLALDGLTTLSGQAAEALGHHQGPLDMGGLTRLSDAAIAGLSRLRGELFLNGLVCLSDSAAESLSAHPLDVMLGLTGLFGLSLRGAESLCGHEGLVAVDFAKLDGDVVEVLQSSAVVRNARDYDEEDGGLTEFDPFSEG